MHTCQPWASAERWGGGLRTLSRTTQDGCFPSCSSISRPMIHFTDTWVIIGVCSSPLGMKLHERSQGGEWGWGVGGGWRRKKRQSEKWVKTKRQEWRGWRWRSRCSEIHLTDGSGLVQENNIFSDLQWSNCCVNPANHLQLMWHSKHNQLKYTAYDLLRWIVKQRL